MTGASLAGLRQRLVQLLLAGIVVIALGSSYGGVALLALWSVRAHDGSLHATDFYTSGANPWDGANVPAAPAEQRLARSGLQRVGTP